MALLPFKIPSNCMLVGPTQSGKSSFAIEVIKNANKLFDPPCERIVWAYGVYQDALRNVQQRVEFMDGLPQDLSTFDGQKHTLLILDDLMGVDDKKVCDLFTKYSHHKKLFIMYMTQNLFFGSKHNRTITLNAQYIIFFKNPRDGAQISHLARQIFPNNIAYMAEAYKDATSKPYGYLLLDLRPETDERFRLRTDIFPGMTQICYVPK